MPDPASCFGVDSALLRRHTEIICLKSGDSRQQILVAPRWQGRVMTSTCDGESGRGYGWINEALIRKGIEAPSERRGLERHFHAFGGEERFWLGPEGGQFGFFFPPGVTSYEFENWKTPPLLDTEPFDLVEQSGSAVSFRKKADLFNNAGTPFSLEIERQIALLDQESVEQTLGRSLGSAIRFVAYRSHNTVKNRGARSWVRESGLPSIWMLGMFRPADDVVVVVPFEGGGWGPKVNDDYFGSIGDDRLRVDQGVAFFRGDGKHRSKIGIPAARAKSICGSYCPGRRTLTLLQFDLPKDVAKQKYVRSQWEHHREPYAGDVVNAYNDGPPSPGAAPLGPFYELESSSPALALAPNQSYTHRQTTMHLQGDVRQLDEVARGCLGVGVATIETCFER